MEQIFQLFSYRHTVVTLGYWKHLLGIRSSHLYRSSSQVIRTCLSTRLEITYLKNTSEQRFIKYLINWVFNNCYLNCDHFYNFKVNKCKLERLNCTDPLFMCLRHPASYSTSSPSSFLPLSSAATLRTQLPKSAFTFHPLGTFLGMRSENCWKISISLAPFLCHAPQNPQTKEINSLRGTRLAQPHMLSVTISDSWDIVSLAISGQPPRFHEDRGKRTAFPVRTTFPLLPVLSGKILQKFIHACCPHPPSCLNTLPSIQRTPKCASKKTPQRSSCLNPSVYA